MLQDVQLDFSTPTLFVSEVVLTVCLDSKRVFSVRSWHTYVCVGQHQGCCVVGTAFPHLFALDYIKTLLRSHRCASDTQIRNASQKLTVKKEDSVEILVG